MGAIWSGDAFPGGKPYWALAERTDQDPECLIQSIELLHDALRVAILAAGILHEGVQCQQEEAHEDEPIHDECQSPSDHIADSLRSLTRCASMSRSLFSFRI
jgi:hypothetical protein